MPTAHSRSPMESTRPEPSKGVSSSSGRDQSPDQQDALQHGEPVPDCSTASMTSEDSQTILLNRSSSSRESCDAPPVQSATPRPPMPPRSSTVGVKKCWICIGDSTEDDPANPPVWKSPCACNLTAHESCLLDWVADLENPKNRKRNPPPGKILCPQCKSEIRIERPKSYIVSAYKAVDRALGTFVVPGLLLSAAGTTYAGLSIHGYYSVMIVFGRDHAARIFREALRHRGWVAAYGLIPLSLIFSRTGFAEFVQPFGTVFLVYTQLQLSERFEIDWTIWPPLPTTVFACLPAMRRLYNFIYEAAFGDLNRKWIQEVQPRQNEESEGGEGNEENAENEILDDDEGGILLQLEVNIGGDRDADGQGGNAGQNNAGAQGADAGRNGEAAQAGGNGNQAGVHQLLGGQQERIMDGTDSIGQNILGALLFPAVSAGMGSLLGHIIPAQWMSSANLMRGRPGLLRNKWGRSVVGGCLFIVLKDALVLYYRWKLAQTHRQRRVMDFDKVTKEYKVSSA